MSCAHTIYMRTWRRIPKNHEAQNKASASWNRKHRSAMCKHHQKWAVKNRGKIAAHRAVYRAIKLGRLVRPSTCSRCGTKCKPQGHHRDYAKKLRVIWLCAKCHKSEHAKEIS